MEYDEVANGWQVRRKDRYGRLEIPQQVDQVWDELDAIDASGTRRSNQISTQLDELTAAFQAWKLEVATSQNRALMGVLLSLVGVMASIVVPLLTR